MLPLFLCLSLPKKRDKAGAAKLHRVWNQGKRKQNVASVGSSLVKWQHCRTCRAGDVDTEKQHKHTAERAQDTTDTRRRHKIDVWFGKMVWKQLMWQWSDLDQRDQLPLLHLLQQAAHSSTTA